MAHSPTKKAAVIIDWATGEFSLEELAEKHKVPKTTIADWVPKIVQNRTEPKLNKFESLLMEFMENAMGMVSTHAKMLADRDYLSTKSTEDILAHAKFIMERADRIVQVYGAYGNDSAPSLPERAEDGSELVIPELVD